MTRLARRAALAVALAAASTSLLLAATAAALVPGVDPSSTAPPVGPADVPDRLPGRVLRRPPGHMQPGVPAMSPAPKGEAAEPAEEDEAGPPKAVNWVDFQNKKQPPFLAAFINVAIVAFLYVYWGKKPIQAALKARRDDVVRQIDEAQTIKREAEARSTEYAAKLEHLSQEVEATRASLVAAGEGEKARIVREAEEKAARMQKDALFVLEQEKKQIRIDLQRDTVATAMTLAEELLRSKLTPADHERVAEEFLATLAAPKAAGGAP
jgi:F-type H+-transporting ATPase subunit b